LPLGLRPYPAEKPLQFQSEARFPPQMTWAALGIIEPGSDCTSPNYGHL
jgi:hypothetical protein